MLSACLPLSKCPIMPLSDSSWWMRPVRTDQSLYGVYVNTKQHSMSLSVGLFAVCGWATKWPSCTPCRSLAGTQLPSPCASACSTLCRTLSTTWCLRSLSPTGTSSNRTWTLWVLHGVGTYFQTLPSFWLCDFHFYSSSCGFLAMLDLQSGK